MVYAWDIEFLDWNLARTWKTEKNAIYLFIYHLICVIWMYRYNGIPNTDSMLETLLLKGDF